jgi:LysM repeat protein
LKLKQKLTILPVSGIRYTIKKGDTLSKIAKKYSVDAEKIKSFNDLKDDALKIGEKIIIPGGKKISPEQTVKKKKIVYSKKKTSQKTVSYTKSKSSLAKIFRRPTTGRFTSPFGRR